MTTTHAEGHITRSKELQASLVSVKISVHDSAIMASMGEFQDEKTTAEQKEH